LWRSNTNSNLIPSSLKQDSRNENLHWAIRKNCVASTAIKLGTLLEIAIGNFIAQFAMVGVMPQLNVPTAFVLDSSLKRTTFQSTQALK